MPIYEYTCSQCGSDFELLIRNGQSPACPQCGPQSELVRRLSVPAGHVAGGTSSLPICEAPRNTGCGLPQCGQGRCGMG